MKVNLFYPDWDYRKDNTANHPLLRVITSQPTGFWFGSSPSKPIKRVQSRVHRLLKRAHPFQPVLVLYSIVVLMNFTSYLYGMSKGLIHMYERSHIYKKLIDRAEQLQETDKDGK